MDLDGRTYPGGSGRMTDDIKDVTPAAPGPSTAAALKAREEKKKELLRFFDPVCTISEKNGKTALLVRHKKLKKALVLRSLPKELPIYAFLRRHRQKHLLEVYEAIPCSDGMIVLEEYVHGVNVSEVLQTGLYTYKGAAKVLRALCEALNVLHENGFVHRDIKPENVMICDDGNVKLIDFDAARRFDAEKTRDTAFLGTVGFAPPEQYGVSQSDPRSDIYSLGVLLNIMMTGAHPSSRLAEKKAGKIVQKCTQINPALRYASVKELAKKI